MREYALVFLVAAAVTYLLTVIAREIAVRTKAVAEVRDRDVHAEPTPYLGGLALLGGMVAAYFVAKALPFLSGSEDIVFHDSEHVLIAGAMICAVGVIDDIFELDALTKLGGQLLAAGYLVINEIQYYFFTLPDGTQFLLAPAQSALLTAFVIAATVNAVNFIDGLDGLAAGVVGVSAAAQFAFCYQLTNLSGATLASTGALLSAALAGACAGFMPHNFNPARIFMGDSGAMLIGFVLAASMITLTGQFPAADISRAGSGNEPTWFVMILPVLIPATILLIPFADMLLAVVRRTRAGRSPFAPDKEHLHHRMMEIGHSHRRAVLIFWGWAALVGFGMVLNSLYSGPKAWIVTGVMVLVTLAATFLLPVMRTPSKRLDVRPAQ
jgi:UDP-GlcNAc:undecaprenyl-phosphate/decaprenyl-phosphate GlcNAc-1-phosphate transferase